MPIGWAFVAKCVTLSSKLNRAFIQFCNLFGIICDFTMNFTKIMMYMAKSLVVNEK